MWLAVLSLASMMGGPQGFYIIFILYGFLLTIPALILLLPVQGVEALVHALAGPHVAAWTGVGIGLLVPVGLFAIAPNPDNAIQALYFLAPLSLGTGILWSLSSIPVLFPRRKVTT